MSAIEWTGKTWNPVVGCRRVSSGCDNCYAIMEAFRKRTQFGHYSGVTVIVGGRIDWTGIFSVAPTHIFEKPLKMNRPTTFFVNSMSDLFGEGVTDTTIKAVFDIMNRCPQHTFQILTKRANRAARLAPELRWTANIWMGVSIEEDKFVARADMLRKIPAAIRFISAEPLVGPLPSLDLTDIDWVIVGGESGRSRHKIRPMDADWARDLRNRCNGAEVAFFFKQWGNWDENGVWHRSKHQAGRELDGRRWDEMPAFQATGGISTFAARLHEKAVAANYSQIMSGQEPARLALRSHIINALRSGPKLGKHIRGTTLQSASLDRLDERAININAWALVDLQESGHVEAEKLPLLRRFKNGNSRHTDHKVYALAGEYALREEFRRKHGHMDWIKDATGVRFEDETDEALFAVWRGNQ
jgi:protein gp37